MRANAARFGRTTRLAAGCIVAIGHAILVVAMSATHADESWQTTMVVIDFPFSLLWLLLLQDFMDPLMFFGMVGSAWWFQITYLFVWSIWAVLSKGGGND